MQNAPALGQHDRRQLIVPPGPLTLRVGQPARAAGLDRLRLGHATPGPAVRLLPCLSRACADFCFGRSGAALCAGPRAPVGRPRGYRRCWASFVVAAGPEL